MNTQETISSIQILTTTSLAPFMQKFPGLKSMLKETPDWDFFVFSAFIGVALNTLGMKEKEIKELMQKAFELDKNIVPAIENFFQFINKNTEDQTILTTNIGLWILWNINREKPTDEEIKNYGYPLGKYIVEGIKSLMNSK